MIIITFDRYADSTKKKCCCVPRKSPWKSEPEIVNTRSSCSSHLPKLFFATTYWGSGLRFLPTPAFLYSLKSEHPTLKPTVNYMQNDTTEVTSDAILDISKMQ